MKNLLKLSALFLFAFTVSLTTGCSDDEDACNMDSLNAQVETLTTAIEDASNEYDLDPSNANCLKLKEATTDLKNFLINNAACVPDEDREDVDMMLAEIDFLLGLMDC